MMAEEEQRSPSPRQSPIEEVENKEAILALHVDFKQTMKDNRRRGRKKARDSNMEFGNLQEVPKNHGKRLNNIFVSGNHTKQIIGYILAMLEEKDRFRYFSIPDDLQTYNYEENMTRPGYFAILRQKLMDGMYASLEEFENDVLVLFRKAIDSNSANSHQYKEAMSMKAEAKQIFHSLRNNFTHTELELSNWYKNYYNQKRKAVRKDRNVGISIHNDESTSRNIVSSDMKQSNDTLDVPANGRSHTLNKNKTNRRNSRSIVSSTPCGSKEASLECSEEHQRSTYKPASSPNDSSFAMMIQNQLEPLVHNEKSFSYQESLRLFVKDAGPAAKLIVERKCAEYTQRVNPQPTWNPSPFGSPTKIGSLGQSSAGANTTTSLSAFSNFAQSSNPFRVSNSSAFSKYVPSRSGLHADTDGKQDLQFDSFTKRMNVAENAGMNVAENAVGSMMPANQITGADGNRFEPQRLPADIHGLSGPNPGLVGQTSSSTSSGGRDQCQRGNRSFPWIPIDLNN